MKWKGEYYVVDDIVSIEQQRKLLETFLSEKVTWKFSRDIAGGNYYPRPGFGHGLFYNEKPHSKWFELVLPIIENSLKAVYENTGEKADYRLEKSRAFMQIPLRNVSGPEYDNHHIDFIEPHLAVLYYVCDADGDTVLFENVYHPQDNTSAPEPSELIEKARITPKMGRVVIFDGYHWHTATQPKEAEVRCVINSNVVLQDKMLY